MLDRKSIARQNILRLMKDQNITQAELGRKIGKDYQYVWRFLKGDRGIGPHIEKLLVQALNLHSVAELYKNPEENNLMLDRLIDRQAQLQESGTNKLELIEKFVDLIESASPEVLEHISRQIDLLKKI